MNFSIKITKPSGFRVAVEWLLRVSSLIIIFLLLSATVSAQELRYAIETSLADATKEVGTFTYGGTPAQVRFNDDGTKLTLVYSSVIVTYPLSTGYDLTSGDKNTTESSFSASAVSDFETFASLSFSPSGDKMFVGGTADDGGVVKDVVREYSLSTPYVIAFTTLDNTLWVDAQSVIDDVEFSHDGSKMFVIDDGVNVDIWNLSTDFDLSTATYGSTELISDVVGQTALDARSMRFSKAGSTVYFSAYSQYFPERRGYYQASMSTAYDIANASSPSHEIVNSSAKGIVLNESGTRMFVLESSVASYDMDSPAFAETSAADGSVEGSLIIDLIDETFTVTSSNLTYTTHYTINNLPTGLTSNLAVDSDGDRATLTFSGSASSHLDTDDLADIQFTFTNSAFTGNDASSVDNSTAHNSGFSINFDDPLPPAVESTIPTHASNFVTKGTSIQITFDRALDPASISSGHVTLIGEKSGTHAGVYSLLNSNKTLLFNPTNHFHPGEKVSVLVNTSTVQSTELADGEEPHGFQFYVDATEVSDPGYISHQISSATSVHPELMDLNGDTYVDIETIDDLNKITWHINDGSGNFTSTDVVNDATEFIREHQPIDMDEDGDIDILAAGYTNDGGLEYQVVWYENDGSQNFTRNVIVNDTEGNKVIFGGDLDLDGDVDIAYRSSSTLDLYYSLNDGSENFTPTLLDGYAQYAKDIYEFSDINNDGFPDIFSGGHSYMSDGEGGYSREYYTSLTFADHSIDINSDGWFDMFYVQGTTIYQRLSNGSGGFTTSALFAANNMVTDFTFADFDGDEGIDIGVGYGNYQPDIYYNNAGSYDRLILGTSGLSVGDMGVADLDGDGDLDHVFGSAALVWYEQGESFGLTSYSPVNGANGNSIDVDGNIVFNFDENIDPTTANASNISVVGSMTGAIDASFTVLNTQLTVNPTSDFLTGEEISVTLTQGVQGASGNILNSPLVFDFTVGSVDRGYMGFVQHETSFGTPLNPEKMEAADMDGDGDPDIVGFASTGNAGEQLLFWLEYDNGDFTRHTIQTTDYTTVGEYYDLDVADIDQDGDHDIVVTQDWGNTDKIFLLINTAGTFSSTELTNVYNPRGIKIADINGDGELDIITNRNYNRLVAYLNDGSGGFDFDYASNLSGSDEFVELDAGDIDDDGDIDLAYVTADGYGWYENDGYGGLTRHETTTTSYTGGHSIYISDLDGNGTQDLVIGSSSGSGGDDGAILWYSNDGSEAFTKTKLASNLVYYNDLRVIDMDGDGDMDVLTASRSGRWYRNNGDGTFSFGGSGTSSQNMQCVEAADFDLDGDLDPIYAEGSNSNQMTWGEQREYQVIDFTEVPDKLATDPDFTLVATSNSATPITFRSSNESIFEIYDGNKVKIKGSGTASLIADQVATDEYLKGTLQQFVEVSKVDQEITFSLTDKTYGDAVFALGGTTDAVDLEVSYVSSDPSIASVDADQLTIHKAGTINITASQSGSTIYNAATPVLESLTISKAELNVSVDDEEIEWGAEIPAFNITYTAEDFKYDDDASDLDVAHTASTTAEQGSTSGAYDITISDVLDSKYTFVIDNGTLTINNNAPTDIEYEGGAIAENNEIDAAVVGFATTDLDEGQEHTYSLVAGTGDDNNALFFFDDNLLRTNTVFDHEGKDSYTVRVQTDDQNGGTYSEAVVINIEDVNEAPTDVTVAGLDEIDFDENTTTGTGLGSLTSEDQDDGDTFTYELVSGTGSDHNDLFTIETGALKTNGSFNHEMLDELTIRIRTTDAGGLSHEGTIQVFVNDISEAPTGVGVTVNKIAENTALGTQIALFTTEDEDEGESYTYSFVAGDNENARFDITDNQLKVGDNYNYEVDDNPLEIDVETNDGNGGTFQQRLSIIITDVSEAPTEVDLDSYSVDERLDAGAVVGNLSSTDEDQSESFEYALVAGEGDVNNDDFDIVNGQLLSAVEFDFETKSSYSIRIQTTDKDGLTYSNDFGININDVDPIMTGVDIDVAEVAENSTVGTAVGNLTTQGEELSGSYTYNLVTGTGDSDNDLFSITNDQLLVADELNFEDKADLSVRIQSNDGNGIIESFAVEISLTDANDAPTDIMLSSNTIDENLGTGVEIGVFSASDEDGSDSHNFMLVSGEGSDDNDSFTISGGRLLSNAAFDYETRSTLSIRVRANDGAADFDKILSVDVNDIFEKLDQVITFNELANKTYGDGSFSPGAVTDATDLDVSFASSNPEIVSVTGGLLVIHNVGTVDITASQSGSELYNEAEDVVQSLTVDKALLEVYVGDEQIEWGSEIPTFNITYGSFKNDDDVNDLDNLHSASTTALQESMSGDYAITISNELDNNYTFNLNHGTLTINNNVPTGLDWEGGSISENNEIDAAVAVFATLDADEGQSHVYTLLDGPGGGDNDLFYFDGNILRTTVAFDFESKDTYGIRVKSDDQNGGQYNRTISINVENANEAPTELSVHGDDNTSFDENIAIGTNLGTLSTNDPDAGDTFTYELVSGTGSDHNYLFVIESDALKTNGSFNHEEAGELSIRIRTTDAGGLSHEGPIQVFVSDISEAPTGVEISVNSIQENNSIGDLIATMTSEDEDEGESHTYSFVAGTNDNASFSIDGDQLKANSVFNFESQTDSYLVEVQTDDGNGGQFTQQLEINVTDLAEAPTEIDLDSYSVDESSVSGTVVGNLSTTDQDDNESFEYALVPGEGDADNAQFDIVNGQLLTNAVFDYETTTGYSIRIQTTDKDGLNYSNDFGISVNDLDAQITNIEMSENSLEENLSVGTTIASFSTQGEDLSGSYTYTFVQGDGDDDNGLFSIEGDELKVNGGINYEDDDMLNIKVQSDDGAGITRRFAFTLTVTNQNDTPTDIELTSQSIDENNEANAEVASLSTVDEDESDTHTYSLVSGDGDTHNDKFGISGTSLTVNEVLDYETLSELKIRIKTDDGNGGVYEEAVTIAVNDVFEKQDQTITFDSIADYQYGEKFKLSATASSSLEVSFAVVSGGATISDDSVTITGVGEVIISADQAGDDDYNTAEQVTRTFNASKADQMITFGELDGKTFGDESFELSASASSDLGVGFSIVSGNATLNEGTVTITGAGEVVIAADQAGDDNYNAATQVTQTFDVAKASQTVTIASVDDKLTTDGDFDIIASSSAGLSVVLSISGPATLSETTVSLAGDAGTVQIIATQSGNDNYLSDADTITFEVTAPVTNTLTSQTITFDEISDKTFGDAAFDLTASSSSGLTVSFSVVNGPVTIDGETVTITGAGLVEIKATQAGDDEYEAAESVTRTFEIAKAEQEVTIEAIDDKLTTDDAFDVSASTTSNLDLVLTVTGPATIDGNTLTLSGEEGTVEVMAIQAGDDNYLADTARVSFEVTMPDEALGFAPQQRIQVYPNPATDFIQIDNLKGPVRLRLFTLEGRQILDTQAISNERIDVSGVKTGTYLITTTDDRSTTTTKILIQR